MQTDCTPTLQPPPFGFREQREPRAAPSRKKSPATPRAAFQRLRRAMARAHAAYDLPGFLVFAVHLPTRRMSRLWMEADVLPSVAVVGRHERADLPLLGDERLSLRHLLLAVRRASKTTTLWAVDLESTHGTEDSDGRTASTVVARGPTLLRLGDYVLFSLPTGEPLPWRKGAVNADWPWEGHAAPAQGPLPLPSWNVGRLELHTAYAARHEPVGTAPLARGLLLGRNERCDLCAQLDTVSRVHAVVLELDGEPFLFDAGSTQGTFRDGRSVRVAALGSSSEFALGPERVVRWRTTPLQASLPRAASC